MGNLDGGRARAGNRHRPGGGGRCRTRLVAGTGLLASLARHSGQVIDHRTLLREVWGPSYGDERNYLRTFIQRLRTKLETDPKNPQIIVTAGTRGYRFGPPSSAEAHIEH
ncbi:MAG TPA: helix-turn-helix domain-containing protein [Methylomirabilota bacterium]|nr:helix-turn-helix domain-containing protein [Methylomirabilota bacterium]